MIRNWTLIELNRMRAEAYRAYANLKYSVAPQVLIDDRYRAYVKLDNLVKLHESGKANVTSGLPGIINKKDTA
ncbi:MAG: hypothetical protein ACPG7F_00160 [Aggregatilineales bacterium]